jgi:polar amino acid transport system substrate-binding protein
MRSLLWCTVLVLTLAALPAGAASPTVALTTGPDYPPFTDPLAPGGGQAVRVVRAVFARMGQEVRLDWLPWNRGYLLTLAGQYQATFPYLHSEERQREFLYSDSILVAQSHLFMRQGDSLQADQPDSFRGRALCVVRGFASPLRQRLQAQIASGQTLVHEAPSLDSCARMLALKRVDAFSALDVQGRAAVREAGLDNQITAAPRPVATLDFALISPRNQPEAAAFIGRFNAALRQLRADGSYKRLLAD